MCLCACVHAYERERGRERDGRTDGRTDRWTDERERERENTSYNYTSYFCGLKSQGNVQYAVDIPAEGSLILMSSYSSH